MAEGLRLNTTLTPLDLLDNCLREGGSQSLAETLRLNTTVTKLSLAVNRQGEDGGRALAEKLRLYALPTSTLAAMTWNSCSLLFRYLLGLGR